MSTITWGGSELIVELLDRQFDYIGAIHGRDKIIRLQHVLDFLVSEPITAALLREMQAESEVRFSQLQSDDRALRDRLRELWRSHQTEIKKTLVGITDAALTAFYSFDSYEKALCAIRIIQLNEENEQEDAISRNLVRNLIHWAKYADQIAQKNSKQPKSLSELLGELLRLDKIREYIDGEIDIARRSLAWAAYERLRSHAARLNPVPPEGHEHVQWLQHEMATRLAVALNDADPIPGQVVFKKGRPPADARIDSEAMQVYADIRADCKLLYEELIHRLGLARSRRAIVERYAARCEAFDSERLREVCDSNSRSAERKLTTDFARYLFDAGMPPLIDASVGALRPDVLYLSGVSMFYVEAKQYSSNNPRSQIKRAYSQVWSTWARLRKLYPCDEAFLVVFRRRGRLVELPPVIFLEGLRLYSVVIDIDTHAGSRERLSPVRLLADELRPNTNGSIGERVRTLLRKPRKGRERADRKSG